MKKTTYRIDSKKWTIHLATEKEYNDLELQQSQGVTFFDKNMIFIKKGRGYDSRAILLHELMHVLYCHLYGEYLSSMDSHALYIIDHRQMNIFSTALHNAYDTICKRFGLL